MERTLNILHINGNYLFTALHQNMLLGLEQDGLRHTVFVPVFHPDNRVVEPLPNVHVCRCFRRLDRVFFHHKQKKIIRAAEREVNVGEFDCIHAYTLFTDGNAAMRLAQRYGKPFVVAVRGTDVDTFFRYMPHLRGLGVRILRKAAAVFFLSETCRETVFGRYVPKRYHDELLRKTHIIPNGIDDFWFQHPVQTQKKQPGTPLRLIYAGRIDRNKNIPTIQKAMALLRQQGVETTLTVVGRPADQAEFEKIRQDPHTNCIPAQPKEKLIDLYRANELFVMPSFSETFGLVYAEAMSQGLPVVYSKGQGFDGQFLDGTVGYPADAHSPASVADAIAETVKHYETIAPSCGSRAEKFRWERICGRYTELYLALTK